MPAREPPVPRAERPGGDWHEFGASVALLGDRALIAAMGADDDGLDSGSAYVFERQPDGAWRETAKLTAAGAARNEHFGRSVALSGDRAVIGAPLTDTYGLNNEGAAYVFERQAGMAWIQTTLLTPGDTDPLSVNRFVLVDADTDQDLFELQDGAAYDLSQLPPHLNIRADVGPAVRSVRFTVRPQTYQRTESVAPFALFGDTNGNYLPGTLYTGQGTGETYLKATPYAEPAGKGAAGIPLERLLRFYSTSQARALATGDAVASVPEAYALEANYPNPFNPSTVIGFSLPEASPVHVAVYDLLGRQVALLAEGPMPAGRHEVSFDGSGLSSGLYLYRLETPQQTFVRRMHLLK